MYNTATTATIYILHYTNLFYQTNRCTYLKLYDRDIALVILHQVEVLTCIHNRIIIVDCNTFELMMFFARHCIGYYAILLVCYLLSINNVCFQGKSLHQIRKIKLTWLCWGRKCRQCWMQDSVSLSFLNARRFIVAYSRKEKRFFIASSHVTF